MEIHGIKTAIEIVTKTRRAYGLFNVNDHYYLCPCGWELLDPISSYPTNTFEAVKFHFENCKSAKAA